MSASLVLCYHAVSESWPAALSVTPRQLAEQVAWLKQRGFRSTTFSEAASHRADGRAVSITFDDAYRSVLDLAFPILREAGFTGTVFAPTGWIGSGEPMSWDGIDTWLGTEHRQELLPMSWEDLAELADHGWEIGSHTRSHPHLPELDDDSLRTELQESRVAVASRLGDCATLAYPYGEYDERVMTATGDAGYSFAGTLWGRRASGGRMDVPRAGIYHADGIRRFRLKASPLARRVRNSPGWSRATALRQAAVR